jgi:hypothetical protein
MNPEINQLTKDIWKNSVDIFTELENIRLTVINVRVCVAKLHEHPEARALDVVADHIQKALIGLEKNTALLKEQAKQIADLNKL